MTIRLLVFLFIFFSCNKRSETNQLKVSKPNIIYINVDDLGWMDTRTYGSTFYETPNIDRLSSMSMRFTRGYAAAANCAPSRACLMSGQNTPRHGIYTVGSSARGLSRNRKLIPIPNTKTLADSVITIAEMLKAVGYRSGSFGKWHLGKTPLSQGFNVNVGGSQRGNPGRDGYFAPYNLKGLKNAPKGENLTDRLTQEAINFMSNEADPFFVYLPFYAVHTPLATSKALEKKYKTIGNPRQHNAKYAGMVETVDTNIGRILNYLETSNRLKNTLIIVTSDNGGIRNVSFQDPLRAGKGSYYEGGIRVPFIFYWDGHIAPNTQNNTPISNLDIYPTLMAVSGSSRANQALDGQSILPLLEGKTLAKRDLFFHFPIYLEAYNSKTDQGRDSLFRTRPGSVIISGDWKLHHYFEDDGLELYNLANDLGERRNLADSLKDKTQALFKKLKAWRTRVGAKVPKVHNPDYNPEL